MIEKKLQPSVEGLTKQRNEVAEELKVYCNNKKQAEAQKEQKQEKLNKTQFNFFDQTETIIAAGIGATAGMIPGALDRASNMMTAEMAVGGIVGGIVGASLPIMFYVHKRYAMKKKLEQLDKEIAVCDQKIDEKSKEKAELTKQITSELLSRPKKQRKEERKAFRKQDEMTR